MNVRTLCLSMLYEKDATGYEIRQMSVSDDCAYFVEASFGSIYPALARLEDDGLLTSRTEQQDGKPAKKIYSITEAGRAAFVQELHEPLGEDVFRSPFLLFATHAHLLPRSLVKARVNEFLERAIEKKNSIEGFRQRQDNTAADAWVINYGRSMMSVLESHLRDHMDELINLSRPDRELDAAE